MSEHVMELATVGAGQHSRHRALLVARGCIWDHAILLLRQSAYQGLRQLGNLSRVAVVGA